MSARTKLTVALCLILTALIASANVWAASLEEFTAAIQSESADVRAEAWKSAGQYGADAVGPLGDLACSANPGVAKAALCALQVITAEAGRPGAEPEKERVASALTGLLDGGKYPDEVRREVLHLLSLCAGEGQVAAIAGLLSDETVAEDARIALDRTPDDAATRALVTALSSADKEMRVRLGDSLARRDALSAVPVLLELARGDDRELAFACLDPLARLGVIPSIAFRPQPSFSEEEKGLYADATLTAAEAMRRQGENKKAESVYLSIASQGADPKLLCAALVGLCELESGKFVGHALGFLAEPGIRDVAKRTLVESRVADTDEKLARAYKGGSPGMKVALLQVLQERGASEFNSILASAKRDDHADVRVAACMLSGVEAAEDDLLAVAGHGSPWIRDDAVAALLDAAGRHVGAGQTEEARGVYEALVKANVSGADLVLAFQGLTNVASKESMVVVKPYVEASRSADGRYAVAGVARTPFLVDDDVLIAAEKAWVAIWAADSDVDAAKAELMRIAESSGQPEVSAFAAEKLSQMGVSPQVLAQRQGFITSWRVLGPFPNAGGTEAFEKSFINESECNGTQGVEIEGRGLEWFTASTESVPAAIGLRGRIEPSESVAAYAYAEVRAEQAEQVLVLIGSDDGCELWVNGQRLHGDNSPRGMVVDQDRVEAGLVPGVNRILLKVLQGAVDWQFCVRMASPDGTPLDMSNRLVTVE